MKRILLLTLSMIISIISFAQVTTSGIRGIITNDSNKPLFAATVIAVHTPSGTQYGAITENDGRYAIQGMRTGGPYTIAISYVGHTRVELTEVSLELGITKNISLSLKEGLELDDVIVSATRENSFNASKTGAAMNFSNEAITNTPTVSRNVYDIVKQSPFASITGSGISFAGTNNRYNSFQIDGAVSNDVFGLSESGTNGGQTNSIAVSLDALEEIQVVVAPFDVRQSGFTGGGINAVTKSGTNTFKGSAYTYFNNQNFYGTTAGEISDGEERTKLDQQSTKIYGATFGGAIVKDKLFYFVSAEISKDDFPISYYPGSSDNYLSEEQASQILELYSERTGYSDTYGQRNAGSQSVDFMARFDYNINQDNKLMFRYQLKDAYDDLYSTSATSYVFNNSSYKMSNNTQSFVAELNSRITNTISNELRAGYTRVRDSRSVDYLGPRVNIYNVVLGADEDGNSITGSVGIGTEANSGATIINQDIFTLTDNITFYKGAHTITAGTHNEFYSIGNTYIANSTGTYTYYSLDDFINDNASQYSYSYVTEGSNFDYLPKLNALQLGFYVQDEWKPSERFYLTGGLRFDIPIILNDPTVNEEFNNSELAEDGTYYVGRSQKTSVLVSPRVGFRYYTDDTHSTLLRGGVGLFTGRVPFVWLHNAYSNNGVDKKSITITSDVPALSSTPTTDGVVATEEINIISEDFKYPQVLRTNIALEQIFSRGWKVTVEGIYSKTFNNVFFRNLAISDEGQKVYAVSQEVANENNSTTYYSSNTSDYSSVILLENTSAGYSYNLSAMVEKSFDFGLNLRGSYTYGQSFSVNDGASSTASANWKYQHTIDPNNSSELGYTKYNVPHRINIMVNYATPLYGNGKWQTVLGMTYEGYSGYSYDMMYSEYVSGFTGNFNGDGQKNNSLIYIPTVSEIGLMSFDSEDSRTSFANWCNTNDYAKNHRGEFVDRYGLQAPFEHHINLHIAQSFFYDKTNNRKIELSLDIMNLGNLINREWGMYSASTYGLQPLKIVSMTETEDGSGYTPTYSWNGSQQIYEDETSSRWYMQLGLKLTF